MMIKDEAMFMRKSGDEANYKWLRHDVFVDKNIIEAGEVLALIPVNLISNKTAIYIDVTGNTSTSSRAMKYAVLYTESNGTIYYGFLYSPNRILKPDQTGYQLFINEGSTISIYIANLNEDMDDNYTNLRAFEGFSSVKEVVVEKDYALSSVVRSEFMNPNTEPYAENYMVLMYPTEPVLVSRYLVWMCACYSNGKYEGGYFVRYKNETLGISGSYDSKLFTGNTCIIKTISVNPDYILNNWRYAE